LKTVPFFKGLSEGFTLLEVLVALIIIGISLGAVFHAFSQSKGIAWKSDEKAEGARITQNILANPALIKAAIKERGKKGVVEGEDQWEYSISVQPLKLEAKDQEGWIEIPSMLKLDLLLVHNSGQRKKTFHLHRWYRR
jgi:prepilin-type N-terminal cleavage/methylation domain-containing protein